MTKDQYLSHNEVRWVRVGYSSLNHLRNFKVDKIKIDRSFIDSMASQQESAAIVSALVGLGSGLGLSVAADGIDETQQRALLLGSGCVQGQGQLFWRRYFR